MSDDVEPLEQWTRPQYAFEPDYPGYDPSQNPAIPMWRYMDFTKFVSMLETRSLFFARADLLGDPFEGSLTRAEAERRNAVEARWQAEKRPARLHATSQAKIRSEVSNSIVSCWHMNPVESMAMWRLYLSGREGLAVKTTFERFVSSFAAFDGEDKGFNEDLTDREILIHVGMVHYVDYDQDTPQYVPRILLKRRSFEHEREIRAVAMDRSWGNSPRFGPDGHVLTRFAGGGDRIPVDLAALITAVYVAPEAQPWFAELVKAVVRRYGFQFSVVQSDLDRDPLF
jgi:hypothetical protein